MSQDVIAVTLSWLAEDEPHRFKFDSAWLFLVTPVTLFAVAAIVRGFTAEDRVRNNCASKIGTVKDAVFSTEVHPALAEIVVKIYPYFPKEIAQIIIEDREYLRGQPGRDPELEATRILSYRASFATSLSSLEEHYGKIHRASSVHGRLVAHSQRCAAAMGFFLVAWLYISCYLMLPTVQFPNALTIFVVALFAASVGWAACEWWGANRENNAPSTLVRRAQQASTGQTS
ncbi:hypothetical protein [Mycobacterium avium]|uniref:hypothetical protein n=1 Tax=Mycobacterium avium TaxID=1764 RepID=UPI0012DB4761|nr:hypothetical protein [Mycobacterium avium]